VWKEVVLCAEYIKGVGKVEDRFVLSSIKLEVDQTEDRSMELANVKSVWVARPLTLCASIPVGGAIDLKAPV
jgi:hypothetical protein